VTHQHLLEERLFDCYLAARAGERIDPPAAEHLADCESCADRYADLTAFMESLQSEGTAEADSVFTPERLRAQHQRIVERLLHVAHPAQVIRFPGRRSVDFVRRSMTTSTSPGSSRWVAAAAAAGLFIGVAVGASYNYGAHSRASQPFAPQMRTPLANPVAIRLDTKQSTADDAFLSDLEIALERPHTRELLAFDAFTPHARDVLNR
jgi:predicted anti-sigma-YlaC factor YlaD